MIVHYLMYLGRKLKETERTRFIASYQPSTEVQRERAQAQRNLSRRAVYQVKKFLS